jgi:hypothetical protein
MEEKKGLRRDTSLLIMGAVIGGLFGIMGGIWNSYFMEWYKSLSPTATPDWTLQFVGASIIMVIFTIGLVFWAKGLLKN